MIKPGSKKWKIFMSKLYGFGAAVVIFGAMFKIMHWPGASVMLVLGLTTEAVIFIFSAFEPIHEDPDWTLVYPELALGNEEEEEIISLEDQKHNKNNNRSTGLAGEFSNMLEQANVDEEVLAKLGEGIRKLGDNALQLGEVSDAAGATGEYVNNLKHAADTVKGLSSVYEQASSSILGLVNSVNESEKTDFATHMTNMTRNLESLNGVYELQLKASSDQLNISNKFNTNVSEVVDNLENSIDDTKKYKDNIAELANNLTNLNKVYGNMLKAMSFTGDNNG